MVPIALLYDVWCADVIIVIIIIIFPPWPYYYYYYNILSRIDTLLKSASSNFIIQSWTIQSCKLINVDIVSSSTVGQKYTVDNIIFWIYAFY